MAKFTIDKQRLLMAYEGFYNEDKDKALKIYENLKGLARSHPVKGEEDMELNMDKISELFIRGNLIELGKHIFKKNEKQKYPFT